jgi:hypothetical protein
MLHCQKVGPSLRRCRRLFSALETVAARYVCLDLPPKGLQRLLATITFLAGGLLRGLGQMAFLRLMGIAMGETAARSQFQRPRGFGTTPPPLRCLGASLPWFSEPSKS